MHTVSAISNADLNKHGNHGKKLTFRSIEQAGFLKWYFGTYVGFESPRLLTIKFPSVTHFFERSPYGSNQFRKVDPRDTALQVEHKVPSHSTNPRGSVKSMAWIASLSCGIGVGSFDWRSPFRTPK